MAHRSQSAPLPGLPAPKDVARAVSLGLSAAVLLIALLVPAAVNRQDMLLTQAIMPVMLLGVVGGLVHGFGYRPRSPVLATMFGPWAAWPLMVSSLVFLIFGMTG